MRVPFFFRFKQQNEEDVPVRWGSKRKLQHHLTQINRSLEEYQKAHHLLTLQIIQGRQTVSEKYTTGIIDTDLDSQCFLIDPLIPDEGNALLKPGVTAMFSVTHLGIRFQFKAKYQRSVNQSGYQGHIFQFPQAIEHIQLRDAFRVKISNAHPIPVVLQSDSGVSLSGNIVDLSATGARIRIPGAINSTIERGEHFDSCSLVLPDGNTIECEAQLIHFEFKQESEQTLLGIRFMQLESHLQRSLSRFINDQQRKERKFID